MFKVKLIVKYEYICQYEDNQCQPGSLNKKRGFLKIYLLPSMSKEEVSIAR